MTKSEWDTKYRIARGRKKLSVYSENTRFIVKLTEMADVKTIAEYCKVLSFTCAMHKKDIAVYKRKIDALSIESQHPMQLIHYKHIYAISIILRQSIVC